MHVCSAGPVLTGVHWAERAPSRSVALLMRHCLAVWHNSCSWDFQNSVLGLISGLVLLRNLKPKTYPRLKWGAADTPTASVRRNIWCCLQCFAFFLDEPFNFSPSQLPNISEKEWWCFVITEKLFWVVINDWHVRVFREEISLELLLCEIIVFRMACEKFLQIYFIFSWYPSSSLFLSPKCNYKMFP